MVITRSRSDRKDLIRIGRHEILSRAARAQRGRCRDHEGLRADPRVWRAGWSAHRVVGRPLRPVTTLRRVLCEGSVRERTPFAIPGQRCIPCIGCMPLPWCDLETSITGTSLVVADRDAALRLVHSPHWKEAKDAGTQTGLR